MKSLFLMLRHLLLFACAALSAAAGERLILNFNPDWRFTKSDPAGANAVSFEDAAWSRVSLPHTFNDTDTFDNWSLPGHKGEQEQWSGRTWYRKTFLAAPEWRRRRVFIEFEGARQIAEVFLNGVRLGACKTGFTPFGFDLTPHLRSGVSNTLAVMVDNRFMRDPADASPADTGAAAGKVRTLAQITADHNALVPERLEDLQADQIPWNNPHWHPAHGGLYRNVRLVITDPLHVTLPLYSFLQTEGPYVYATEVGAEGANLHVEVPVKNARATDECFVVAVEIFNARGERVLARETADAALAADEKRVFAFSGAISVPQFWEPESPHLYRVAIQVKQGAAIIDSVEVPFGLRIARWDPTAGLFLNGRHVKLHGWGQKPTNEWPGLGAALPDWLHDYTLKLMKDAGGNFVRWGHCPAGPAQIAAGDRLGVVALQPGVDGEGETVRAAWELRASAFRDVVIYYRNNPSILIWEGGNQKLAREKVAELRTLMDRYDPHGGRVYAHRRADQVTAEFMDVGIGTEGGREIARLAVVEGEYNREESPRRVWDDFSPPNFGYPEAKGQTYQLTSERFAANQVGHYVKKLGAPEHSGGANWIFSDSTSGGRVAVEVARASGEVDGVRLPKEAYYVCAAMFRDDPQVHIIGHWTYPAGTTKDVFVVSNADDVELLLNGRSLGRGTMTDKHLFTFRAVHWEPGELRALARRNGEVIAEHGLRTAGRAVALRLTPIAAPGGWRADGADIALVDVEAVDADGRRCPTLQQRVDFELSGPATWRGGYNSGKLDSINHLWLDLEAGVNRIAVRAGFEVGAVTLRARSAGLAAAVVELTSRNLAIQHGATTEAPAFIAVPVPSKPVLAQRDFRAGSAQHVAGDAPERRVGRFIKRFNYSGPSSAIVHVESLARDGRNAYVDGDSPFASLPVGLVGADWVQAANRESLYHAVDLMQLEVPAGVGVTIAHDDRLPRPPWLSTEYQPTGESIVCAGATMSLFRRVVNLEASLTLGPNTESSTAREGNMYLVFVSGP